mmetsp:Transcript_18967/g.41327  ORF Transcript_18967/g.41327 Transcript_18967/m.41327 type:complete len:320 (-) Transcript_18967:430-1389(-)
MALSIFYLPLRRSTRVAAATTSHYSNLSWHHLQPVSRYAESSGNPSRRQIFTVPSSRNRIYHLDAPSQKSNDGLQSQHIRSIHDDTADADAETVFDTQLIRSSKPFHHWLSSEMRSNHAGETGAVKIYEGALLALNLRRTLRFPPYSNSARGTRYEDDLRAFAEEHKESEQGHLDLLEEVLDVEEHSAMLPAWRVSGIALGFASTFFCPRGMYLTTEAVESFVEEHYGYQIRRLTDEIARGGGKKYAANNNDTGKCDLISKKELLGMLQHCCEDEVEHKDEARERAAEGPLPWFPWVDTTWQLFVGVGSGLAANVAKRI